jgi:hypothetical protein
MSLSGPMSQPEFFEYFLDSKNHKPGIPLDMISYHFYAVDRSGEGPAVQQYTFFEQADHFLDAVRYIQAIRQRLSPPTMTTVNELGTYLSHDLSQGEPGHVFKPIPDSYWNLSGAVFAYVYGGLASLGVEVAGESALAQLPDFFPSVTMMDWTTGQPNARYWVLKLLRENLGALPYLRPGFCNSPGKTQDSCRQQARPHLDRSISGRYRRPRGIRGSDDGLAAAGFHHLKR